MRTGSRFGIIMGAPSPSNPFQCSQEPPIFKFIHPTPSFQVKRRPDGTRYITRRPLRSRVLKAREEQLNKERIGLSTDDDAASELKAGKFWSREDRKRHLERAKERKKRHHQIVSEKVPNPTDKVREDMSECLHVVDFRLAFRALPTRYSLISDPISYLLIRLSECLSENIPNPNDKVQIAGILSVFRLALHTLPIPIFRYRAESDRYSYSAHFRSPTFSWSV